MAAYFWRKTKENTTNNNSIIGRSEFQGARRNDEPIVVPIANSNATSADSRVVVLHPAILDTLDSVHRSLLLKNLTFDTDKPNPLDEQSSSDISYPMLSERQSRNEARPLESIAPTTRKPTHGKVNIAETATNARSTEKQEAVEAHEEQQQTFASACDGGFPTLDEELEALFGKDWNNNDGGHGGKRASKVRTMVQQYEQNKPTAAANDRSNLETTGLSIASSQPDFVSAFGETVETSDFESGSLTSGSSVGGGDGGDEAGSHSVRTSSAFSEGSRDVVSMDHFKLAEDPASRAVMQEEQAAGHNTMITININYRCDNNPLRINKATFGDEGDKEAAREKTVDIVVSGAAASQTQQVYLTKSQSSSDSKTRLGVAEGYGKSSATDARGQHEPMELEQSETTTESDVPVAMKGDAGRGKHKTERLSKETRSSLTSNRSRCRTPDDEEYHDCDNLHDSTLSFYEEACSQPTTPQERKHHDAVDGEQPMIRIVQELAENQREVTSTITLSKAQVREMQQAAATRRSVDSATDALKGDGGSKHQAKEEKRRKSHTSAVNTASKKRHDKSNLQRQQRIIDDNFCNEILDSTIHFDRLYGIKRVSLPEKKDVEEGKENRDTESQAETCLSDSIVCGGTTGSLAEESFESAMSLGKLEGKPRFSGKTAGRLMMKRLKKLHGGGQKPLDTSDVSTSSSQTSGPKKPPRTFAANVPKRSAVVPSCPSRKDVEGGSSDPSEHGLGWKLDTKPRTHQVGWTVPAAGVKNDAIPAQVYSMLHYSEDEGSKQLIKTGHSKPAPQQPSKMPKYWPDGEPVGPRMNIDTVDGMKTPSRRHSTSTDFERFVLDSNVKSTPQHREVIGSRCDSTRRRTEQFLSYEKAPEDQRVQAGPDRRRRRTTGGIFERRRQQQENFLDDARRTNHEPRRRKLSKGTAAAGPSVTGKGAECPMAAGKVEKRRTYQKAGLLKRTVTLFEASKKKIWTMKKFETPKKLNAVSNTSRFGPDPNINCNSSGKKKYNLHHKHLGYTPDHLRSCKSCGADKSRVKGGGEDVIVSKNYRPVRSNPSRARDDDKENRITEMEEVEGGSDDGRQRRVCEEINRKSARSLNFASAPQNQRLNSSPVDQPDNGSPRKFATQLNETKFLKTLRNLKISPKRMFRFSSHFSTTTAGDEESNSSLNGESHVQGEFQSFDDLNLDDVANMGDFLSNIRQKIDGAEHSAPGQASKKRSPKQGGQSVATTSRRAYVPMDDVHDGEQEDDPIYQEISPKGNKMVLNEFISSDTNKRYLMVNNNPNILYAMVESKSGGRLVKARSLTNVQGSSSLVDPTVTSTPISKPLNNTCKSQVKPRNRRVTMSPGVVDHQREDADTTGEPESCLYSTALTGQQDDPSGTAGRDSSGGESRVGRSFNATGSSIGSSIRRSLFARPSSIDRSASTQQHDQSTDDSDISILQEEESGEFYTEVSGLRRGYQSVEEPLIVRERVEDRLLAARKETERFQQKPPTGRWTSQSFRGSAQREDLYAFEKDIIVEQQQQQQVMANNREERRDDMVGSVLGEGQNFVTVKKANKAVQVKAGWDHPAPLSCFDTDGEIESLRKYDDGEIQELVFSLNDAVRLSDIETIDSGTTASSVAGNELDDVGYDTVDLPPVSSLHRHHHHPVGKNLTIDTVDVSELISQAPEDSRLSPANISNTTSASSGSKLSTTGAVVLRNLKDKLRSSFRKSKTFIKNERQRIVSYLAEDRTGSRSSSAVSSPTRRYTVQQQTQATTPGRSRTAAKSPRQESESEADDQYQSLTDESSFSSATTSLMEHSNQHMSELMEQLIQQGDARKQLKQALAICRSKREFECSPELIEAERLLLVATQKETAVRNELNQIDYQSQGMSLPYRERVGTVTLRNFEFPLKEAALRDTLFNYFYVVVCTYKHEVKATIAKERHSSDGRVYFQDCAIQFHNLDPNYAIKVEVFVLQLRKNVKTYSFESRYHLEKDTKRFSCPSPTKKLREAGRKLSFRSTSQTFDFDNEFSRFKSQGFFQFTSLTQPAVSGDESEEGGEINAEERPFDATYATARTSNISQHASSLLEDGDDSCSPLYYSTAAGHSKPYVLQQDGRSVVFMAEDFKNFALDSMAYTSNMSGTIGMSVRTEARFEGVDVSGFLDVGVKADDGISWSRRWGKINGYVIEFWNYPQECQEKQPILRIDLVKCPGKRINPAERMICSRPRTIKVETVVSAGTGTSCNSSGIGSSTGAGGSDLHRSTSPTTDGNVVYLLAADTVSDMKRWLVELNRVVLFLKGWKI